MEVNPPYQGGGKAGVMDEKFFKEAICLYNNLKNLNLYLYGIDFETKSKSLIKSFLKRKDIVFCGELCEYRETQRYFCCNVISSLPAKDFESKSERNSIVYGIHNYTEKDVNKNHRFVNPAFYLIRDFLLDKKMPV